MKLWALAFGCAALLAFAPAFSQTTAVAHPVVLFKTTLGLSRISCNTCQAANTPAPYFTASSRAS
jgi:hypothetical protein